MTDMAQQPAAPIGYKNAADALKALRLAGSPLVVEQRNAFLARLKESPRAIQISFQLLATLELNPKTRDRRALLMLQDGLAEILAAGRPIVKLESFGGADQVRDALNMYFPTDLDPPGKKMWASSGRALWPLYLVMRTYQNPVLFAAGLRAYRQCIAAMVGVTKHTTTSENGGFVMLRLAKALPKLAPDSLARLRVVATWIDQLESVHGLYANAAGEVAALANRAEEARKQADDARTSLAEARSRIEAGETQAKRVAAEMESLREELERERSLFDQLKTQAAREAVQAVDRTLAEIRGFAGHRLENIRLLAEQPSPDGKLISTLAKEIEGRIQPKGTKPL